VYLIYIAYESIFFNGISFLYVRFIEFLFVYLHCSPSSAVRARLRRMPPMEMGLLKPRDKEVESEDEML